MSLDSVEYKNVVKFLLDNIKRFFSLGSFKTKVDEYVKEQYDKGREDAEVELNVNFVDRTEDTSFLENYVNESVEGVADEIGTKLKGEISRGLMNGENVSQIKTRIRTVLKDDKYNNRLKTIFRTEGKRAREQAALDGVKSSGLEVMKYLDVVDDGRTSNICKAEMKKYGSSEQAIALDKEFVVRVDNKTYRALHPPFHPNCRTTLRFKRIKEE